MACGGSVRTIGMTKFELDGEQSQLANELDAEAPVTASPREQCNYWHQAAIGRSETVSSDRIGQCLLGGRRCADEHDTDPDPLLEYLATRTQELCVLADDTERAEAARRAAEEETAAERVCQKKYSELLDRHAEATRERDSAISNGKAEVERRNEQSRRNAAAIRNWIQTSIVVKQLPCAVARPAYSVCYNHVDVPVPCNSAAAAKKNDHDAVLRFGVQISNRSGTPLACDFGEEHYGVVLAPDRAKESKIIRPGQSERFTREWSGGCSGANVALLGAIRHQLRCEISAAHRREAGVDSADFDWFSYDAEDLRLTVPSVTEVRYREPPGIPAPAPLPSKGMFMRTCMPEARRDMSTRSSARNVPLH